MSCLGSLCQGYSLSGLEIEKLITISKRTEGHFFFFNLFHKERNIWESISSQEHSISIGHLEGIRIPASYQNQNLNIQFWRHENLEERLSPGSLPSPPEPFNQAIFETHGALPENPLLTERPMKNNLFTHGNSRFTLEWAFWKNYLYTRAWLRPATSHPPSGSYKRSDEGSPGL